MKNKFISITLASVLSAALLAGCGNTATITGSTESSSATSSTEGQTEKSSGTSQKESSDENTESHGKLAVSFPTGNIRIAINILALEKGYFDEEGVEIEQVNLQGTDALTAINNGNGSLDVLNVGFVPDLQAIGSGYDLKIIGGTAVEGGAIVAKKENADNYKNDDTVINIDGVTAAKLGFVRNESSWVITRQYLLDNGVSADTLSSIEDENNGHISYYQDETSVAQAVQKGEVDVAFLPMEYALLYADAYDLEVVAAAGDLQENYVCCREVTSTSSLEEKYDAFVAYERARIRAFEYYKQGETDDTVKADVVDTVAKFSGKETDYVETYLYGGVTKYAVDPNSTGVVKYVEAANNSGLLSSSATDFSTYDITQNIDTSAYEEAITSLVEENPDDTFYAQVLEEYKEAN